MNRLERHERIVATEYYLYGGVVDVPKIYDADGNNHSERFVKGADHGTHVHKPSGESVLLGRVHGSDLDWVDSV